MRIAGIDPGKKGVVVALDSDGGGMRIHKLGFDSAGTLVWDWFYKFTKDADINLFIVERPRGRGGFTATSTFALGEVCGQVRQVVAQTQIPWRHVDPKVWQEVIHKGIPANRSPKIKSQAAYEQLYPHKPLPLTPRSKKTDDNLIDALLIATYGVLKYGGGKLQRWDLCKEDEDA